MVRKHTPTQPAPNRDGAQVSDVQGTAQAHGTVPQLSSFVLAESSSPGSAERGQKHTPTQPAPNREVSDVYGIAQVHGTVAQLSSFVLAESSSPGSAERGQKHTPTQPAPNRDGAQLRPTEQYLSSVCLS